MQEGLCRHPFGATSVAQVSHTGKTSVEEHIARNFPEACRNVLCVDDYGFHEVRMIELAEYLKFVDWALGRRVDKEVERSDVVVENLPPF